MEFGIKWEIHRLAWNAGFHRADLLQTSGKKAKWRRAFVVTAGLLSLLSAGAITTVLSNLLPKTGMQLIAALVAGVSGAISLFSTSYFSENEIHAMYSGASKYLSLREAASRLATGPEPTEQKLFGQLTELQKEYARLDELYARYFTLKSKPRERKPGGPTDTFDTADPPRPRSLRPFPIGSLRPFLEDRGGSGDYEKAEQEAFDGAKGILGIEE